MQTAFIRFYEELNEFLPHGKQKIPYAVAFRDAPSVKSLIESEGVPHTEVDLILVNGRSVGFSEKITDQDHISVYPVFESFDISGVQAVHLKPLRVTRFVLDVHLGKLARYLRMLGFDTVYNPYSAPTDLVRISKEDQRIILSRDRRLLMRREVDRGYWVRHEGILEQVAEVLRRLDLSGSIRWFSRCTACNGSLQNSSETEARKRFPDHRFEEGTRFSVCTRCGHLYWNGSHSDRFRELVAGLA
jgi:uncharacterized protein with PIN domain